MASGDNSTNRPDDKYNRWDWYILIASTACLGFYWTRGEVPTTTVLTSLLFLVAWTWSVGSRLRTAHRKQKVLDGYSKNLDDYKATLDARSIAIENMHQTLARQQNEMALRRHEQSMRDLRNAVANMASEREVVCPKDKPDPPSVYDRLMGEED